MAIYLYDDGTGAKILTEGNAIATAEACCCNQTPSTCPNSYPEILLTVTGTTGTISWGGLTWTLPAESGVEKISCPTCYHKGKQNGSWLGSPTLPFYHAVEIWNHNTGQLYFWRDYMVLRYNGQWGRYDGPPYYTTCAVGMGNHMRSMVKSNQGYFVFGNSGPLPTTRPPVPGFINTFYYSNLGLSYTYAASHTPFYSDYALLDKQISTTAKNSTQGGITYTWRKGNGW